MAMVASRVTFAGAQPSLFEGFAARKTAVAAAARLPPLVTDLDLAADNLPAVGNAWTRRHFDGGFYLSPSPEAARPACSLVFVQSLDGNTGASNPATLGGGATDKHLIYEGLSQVAADAVLAGADTVRGGDIVFAVWHPELVRLRAALGKPRYPTQIVATRHGLDLDALLLFNVPTIPVVVITSARGEYRMRDGLAARPWVVPLVLTRARDLPLAFETLRASGIARISAVGGRHLATQLIDAGLVQDLYLTTSPRAGGERGTPLYAGDLSSTVLVRKHGTGPEAGVVFEHHALRGPAVTDVADDAADRLDVTALS
ncbi:MAG: dihydrofolate reductase family protein [Vicinamibacterales bacterium]|nr:dihydrofolate reductase family protein [Vicinamibacterales bacterium]